MGVEDGGVEKWGVLKRPADLPLHGQRLMEALLAGLALDSGPLGEGFFFFGFGFGFSEVRSLDSDPRQGRRSELQRPQKGQGRGLGSHTRSDAAFLT